MKSYIAFSILKKNHFNILLNFLFIYGIIGNTSLFSQQKKGFQDANYTINEAWKFSKENLANAYKMDFSDKNWTTVAIPHTWNNEDAMDETSGFFRGACWYRRVVFIGEEAKGKNTIIHFDGANQVVDLYVNEKLVGNHIGGSTAFSFDITKYIKVGKPNLFAIKVDNSYNENIPPLTADYTFFGGINRPISLSFVSPIHISNDDFASSGIYIKTPKVSEKEATVAVKTIIKNTLSEKTTLLIIQKYCNPKGEILKVVTNKLTLDAGESKTFEANPIQIKNPELWSPDSPKLYTLITTLIDENNNTIQEKQNIFGLRWFEFTADKGFYLNGNPLKLIGVNRHEVFDKLGNALRDEMHLRDMNLIKEMGGNFLRISHYPQDQYILDRCDKLGIITMVEIPIVNAITESELFLNNSLHMAEEMVKQNFNHPSLVTWAYMNEVMLRPPFKKEPERHAIYCKEVNRQAKAIEKLIRELDPNRYTLIPCHGSMSAYKEAGLFEIPKIVGLNLYQGWDSGVFSGFDDYLDNFHKEYPNTPMIITEYGADVDSRLHSFLPERFDYTAEYGNLYHEHYLKAIQYRDFVSGAAIWNLNDFFSENRAAAVPHVNNKGITGLDREKKDTYLLYQANLLKNPFVAFGSSSWENRAGVETQSGICTQYISIYTNLPKVEVTLNSKTLGVFITINGVVVVPIPFVSGINIVEAIAKSDTSETTDFYKTNFQIIPKQIQNSNFESLNVMLGSNRYFEDKEARICWIPEQPYTSGSWGYIGGKPFKTKTRFGELPASELDILNTTQDPIFQTQRNGIEEFKADVSDGQYEVYFYWAHLIPFVQKEALAYNLGNTSTYENASNYIFDVVINGNTFLQNLDIPNQIGAERAIIKSTLINATEGKGISIKFNANKEGKTYLNAIRIVKIK
jgi:beta-galactosidase